MPIQEHGVPADIINAGNFRSLTKRMNEVNSDAWNAHMERFATWQKLRRMAEKKKENPFGATGLTAGKFINLWVENCGSSVDHVQRSIKALKNTLEMMDRVNKRIDLRTVKSVYQLRENDKKQKVNGDDKKPSNVKFSRDEREKIAASLRKNGFTDRQIAHILVSI